MFEKAVCIDNIYALAKDKGLKIGDMEEKAGASKGYLSRLNKEGNTAVPPIDFLNSIADQLGVSLDFLVNYKKDQLTEGEDFLLKFLDKVQHRTICGKLEWQCESESLINDGPGSPVDNPLVNIVEEYSDEFDKFYKRYRFNSRFGDARLIGYTYHTDLAGSNAKIYIMKVHYLIEEKTGFPHYSMPMHEIYLVEKNIIPLCSSFFVRSYTPLKDKITELYNAIETATSRIGLSKDSKKLMENFMSGHWD